EKNLLRAQAVVLFYRAQHVRARHVIPGHHVLIPPGLLRLPARFFLRVNVGDYPRPDIVELDHSLLIHGHKVRGAWRKRDEASWWHGPRLARRGLLAPPHTQRP